MPHLFKVLANNLQEYPSTLSPKILLVKWSFMTASLPVYLQDVTDYIQMYFRVLPEQSTASMIRTTQRGPAGHQCFYEYQVT